MKIENQYQVLNKQVFSNREYSLVPIRYEDRHKIMQWRNEQIYHLRQNRPLTAEDQDHYFNNVIVNLFDKERPDQVLFSYLENDKCIGYGGLVHINWLDKNAEISFVIDTTREREEFHKHWSVYLALIEEVAFKELLIHKVYTYAFDLRPHLYEVLQENAYIKEALLKEHASFGGKFIDVVVHAKINLALTLRPILIDDLDTTFLWATDKNIRKYALTSNNISFEEHRNWFVSKLSDPKCYFYIVEIDNNPIGSIRFDTLNNEAIISYLMTPSMHGRGLGKRVLHEGVKKIFELADVHAVKGIVLKDNLASLRIFESLGYESEVIDDKKILFTKSLI